MQKFNCVQLYFMHNHMFTVDLFGSKHIFS